MGEMPAYSSELRVPVSPYQPHSLPLRSLADPQLLRLTDEHRTGTGPLAMWLLRHQLPTLSSWSHTPRDEALRAPLLGQEGRLLSSSGLTQPHGLKRLTLSTELHRSHHRRPKAVTGVDSQAGSVPDPKYPWE